MMHNKKRNRKKENYDNSLDEYKKRIKRQQEILEKYTVQMQLLLQIYFRSESKNIINEDLLIKLARTYTIHTSEMYKITTYQTESTIIVDNNNTIILKKMKSNLKSVISDMLDIAVLKGWDLKSLEVEGNQRFVNEVKKQIRSRLSPEQIQLEMLDASKIQI